MRHGQQPNRIWPLHWASRLPGPLFLDPRRTEHRHQIKAYRAAEDGSECRTSLTTYLPACILAHARTLHDRL